MSIAIVKFKGGELLPLVKWVRDNLGCGLQDAVTQVKSKEIDFLGDEWLARKFCDWALDNEHVSEVTLKMEQTYIPNNVVNVPESAAVPTACSIVEVPVEGYILEFNKQNKKQIFLSECFKEETLQQLLVRGEIEAWEIDDRGIKVIKKLNVTSFDL